MCLDGVGTVCCGLRLIGLGFDSYFLSSKLRFFCIILFFNILYSSFL